MSLRDPQVDVAAKNDLICGDAWISQLPEMIWK
jgi:hypothetical protein